MENQPNGLEKKIETMINAINGSAIQVSRTLSQSIDNLIIQLKKAEKASSKLSRSANFLTLALVFIGIIQVIIALFC